MKRIVLMVLLLVSISALAQEYRATLTGRVTDSAGAVIPKATVTVTSEETGAISKTLSGPAGYYTVPFLPPGLYEISVDVTGFKPYLHKGVELLTQQTVTEDVALAIGSTTETVTVTTGSPLIDVATSSTGQVLTSEEVSDLPSNGRSPLGFARDAYGAIPKMKHATAAGTPFDNSTVYDFSLGGGLSASNEYLLNGVPNMSDSSRLVAFSPFMDAVNTISVDEFNANASTGDTSGGTVDITTKSGTNQFHGSASEFYQGSTVGGAKQFLNTAVSNTHYNQYGATVGGPFWIPKVFDLRNKLFFFYAYEGYVGETPPTTTVNEVPTCAERGQTTGSDGFCADNPVGTPDYPDFSALLNISSSYQLYDPYSSTGSGTTSFQRAMIPGNKFANAINATGGTGIALDPIARAMLAYVPAPNATTGVGADGEDNYSTLSPNPANYGSQMGRLDYNISGSNKIFGEAHRSKYLTSGSDYFHDLASGTLSDVIYAGGLIDDIETFGPTLSLDTRLGMSRYTTVASEKSAGFNPSSLGFPAYIAGNSTALALPVIKFTDATSPLSIGSTPGTSEDQDTIQFFSMLSKVHGHHTYKAGLDIRAQKQSNLSPGSADGTFTFANVSTNNPVSEVNIVNSSNTGKATPAPFGSAFALFDLGIPTSGSEGIAIPYQYNNWYSAYFVQDDWKAASNLTVSLGLRLEHETPENESGNRIVAGWNPNTTNAITSAAEAAYATNYAAAAGAPDLPASISPTGGAIYATSSNRSAYSTAALYISPRLGISWAPEALHEKTVIRL
ncbi:MAG: carboxypeptidase-like regulatory domain-containing protein, partial [Thermoguttaceae bacterium]